MPLRRVILPSVVDYLARYARNSARDPTPISRPPAVSRFARPLACRQTRVVRATVAEKGLSLDLRQPTGVLAELQPFQHQAFPEGPSS